MNAEAPTLLTLPGLDGIGDTADEFVSRLGGRVRPVRVSYPARPHLSYRELARYVLDRCPPTGPVILLAESFSTAVAVAVAALRPPGLLGLVLVTPMFGTRPRLPLRTALRFYPRRAPALRPPTFALRWLLLGGCPRSSAAALARCAARADPRVMLERLRYYLTEPAGDDPAGVGVPVLAIRASRDRILERAPPPRRPNVEWATVDAPHLVLAAAPATAAELVAGFVARACEGG